MTRTRTLAAYLVAALALVWGAGCSAHFEVLKPLNRDRAQVDEHATTMRRAVEDAAGALRRGVPASAVASALATAHKLSPADANTAVGLAMFQLAADGFVPPASPKE